MLGFRPLGSLTLETPNPLAERMATVFVLGGVALGTLPLAGGKLYTGAAALAAEPTAAFAATATTLHLHAAFQASPTALSMLSDAALHRAPTMHAAAAAATVAQASRLNLAQLHLVASASTSLDAGAVYTIHLPRALAAASSSTSDISPIHAVPLPRALFADGGLAISASANITPTAKFVASGVVDLALVDANLRRSALFDADGVLNVAGSGYLNRGARMHSDGGLSVAGAGPRINLERWLAASPSSVFASTGALGVPATLWAASSAELAVTNATETPKPQLFPSPTLSFTQIWLGGFDKVVSYSVRYDVVVRASDQTVNDVAVDTQYTEVVGSSSDQTSTVETPRLAIVTERIEGDVVDV